MPKIREDGYYVIIQKSKGSKPEIWESTAGYWYRPGDEEVVPNDWIKKVVRKLDILEASRLDDLKFFVFRYRPGEQKTFIAAFISKTDATNFAEEFIEGDNTLFSIEERTK